MLLQPLPAAADARSYVLGIEEAHSFVREGLAGRQDAARQAIAVLRSSTGVSQPEILDDLQKTPPNYLDADRRLNAVAAALGHPGDTADPGTARDRLHAILSQPRYASLNGQQSLWDRFWTWVARQFFGWLATLHLETVPAQFWYGLLALAVLTTGGVALLLVRSGWSRAGRPVAAAAGPGAAPASRDRFADADAAAARGDFDAALRSLVAGVATEVSDRPYWDSSPLTVRELFRAQGRLEQLRQLLADFERIVYGGRSIAEEDYRRAKLMAEPFRKPAAAGEVT